MSHRRCTLLLCFAATTLGACASEQTLDFRVMRPDTDEPVAAAHVRALPIGLSPAPLPITPESLREAGAAQGDDGFTNAQGVVVLQIDAMYDHLIEVRPPAFDPSAAALPSQWLLDAETGTLTPQRRTNANLDLHVRE